MPKEASFLGSSIGKKIVMAVTGIILVGFAVGHMAGNLQLYLPAHGPEHPLDIYGRFLREMVHGAGIWVARATLLAAALLHVWAAFTLTKMNNAARPVAYLETKPQASTLASRSMRVSGVVVLAFIVFHLLHLTLGKIGPFVHAKVFENVVKGFNVPWISAFYIVAMVCLFGHLRHGVWSMLQTLGLSHPSYNALRDRIAIGVAGLVVAVNISFPLAVLAGFVKL
jgi:succinate dehydrogenase / fumarate reductase cytochrome b subunit